MKLSELIIMRRIFLTILILMMVLPLESAQAGAGGRNPFLLPSGVYPLSRAGSPPAPKKPIAKLETGPKEAGPLPLKVKAILIGDQVRLASIGRSIVTVGDSIDGEKVLEIKPDRVILGKGDKKRTLLLDQSPIQLATEEK